MNSKWIVQIVQNKSNFMTFIGLYLEQNYPLS